MQVSLTKYDERGRCREDEAQEAWDRENHPGVEGVGYVIRLKPFPLFSALLSAYAQFVCGILFILGAATRYAAVVMIINFIAAIIIAHVGDTYPNTFPALMMLAAACFFLLHGAGKLSVDDSLQNRFQDDRRAGS